MGSVREGRGIQFGQLRKRFIRPSDCGPSGVFARRDSEGDVRSGLYDRGIRVQFLTSEFQLGQLRLCLLEGLKDELTTFRAKLGAKEKSQH